MVQLSYLYMTNGKAIALTIRTFVSKVMSLLFNMLPRFVTALLPGSKHLLISWLQSPSTMILEPKKIKVSLFPLFPHLFAMRWWDQMPWSYFECWVLSQLFHSPKEEGFFSFFTLIKRLFSSSLFSATRVVSCAYLMLIFLSAILIPACDSSSLGISHDALYIEVK